MPEFLVIRKRKFEALKNLYNEKQLTAIIFKNSVQKIIDEIQKKIKQFTNTERKLRNYLLVFDKKAPRIPLRPKEKQTAEEFLRELLTELENDTSRSEYKNELEGFLIELLNEIDTPAQEDKQQPAPPFREQQPVLYPVLPHPEDEQKEQEDKQEDKQTEQPAQVLQTKQQKKSMEEKEDDCFKRKKLINPDLNDKKIKKECNDSVNGALMFTYSNLLTDIYHNVNIDTENKNLDGRFLRSYKIKKIKQLKNDYVNGVSKPGDEEKIKEIEGLTKNNFAEYNNKQKIIIRDVDYKYLSDYIDEYEKELKTNRRNFYKDMLYNFERKYKPVLKIALQTHEQKEPVSQPVLPHPEDEQKQQTKEQTEKRPDDKQTENKTDDKQTEKKTDDKQTEKKTVDKQTEKKTEKRPFRDYFNTSKFNELSENKQEEVIYFDDERGYIKIMKEYLDKNTGLTSKQVKTIVNSPLYVIKDWYSRNKITYPIEKFLDAYKDAREKNLVKKKSDGYESSYEQLLSDDFKNLSLEQQEEELKSSNLFRKVIDMFLNRKKIRFSNPQKMSYDVIKKSMIAGGADFPVKKLINRLIKISSILNL